MIDELIISPLALAISFALIAFLYSSVGLGGGSSYSALLAIMGVNHLILPSISLTLNLIVTSIGSINYGRAGYVKLKLLFPFLVTSIPMSYIGGLITLPKNAFYFLLMVTLIFVVVRIYLFDNPSIQLNLSDKNRIGLSLGIGGLLGSISGALGIGGGVYLVPFIIIFGLGTEKEAAATGALFIWLNSLSGITARIHKFPDIDIILPLCLAVLMGALGGSFLGSNKFQPKTMQKLLGSVIIIAIIFLFKKVVL